MIQLLEPLSYPELRLLDIPVAINQIFIQE